VASVGTASDADGGPLSVSVSNVPSGAQVTSSVSNGVIFLSAIADCGLVTTLSARSYPITLTVTDSNGSTASASVNLIVKPNPAPDVGVYPDISVGRNGSAASIPTSEATDENGNFVDSPYSVTPATLPGGGATSIDQSTGTVTATATGSTSLGTTSIRVTVLDSCGASVVRIFNVNVVSALPPAITNGPPPSQVALGSAYNFAYNATGDPAPTFTLKSGTLPPGITLSSSGVLSGMPGYVGACDYPDIVITATNGNQPEAEQMFSLSIVTRADNYLSSFGLTGGNAGWMFDYDKDGIVNLMEYALQLDPTRPGVAETPAVTVKNYGGTDFLSITFIRSSAATDITYKVEGSTDLSAWSELASSVGGDPTSGPGFVSETGSPPNLSVEVRDTVPLSSAPDGKRFLRLKVSSP